MECSRQLTSLVLARLHRMAEHAEHRIVEQAGHRIVERADHRAECHTGLRTTTNLSHYWQPEVRDD